MLLIDKNTVKKKKKKKKKKLLKQLHLRRLLIKWIPHQLTNEHKCKFVTFVKALFSKLDRFSEE